MKRLVIIAFLLVAGIAGAEQRIQTTFNSGELTPRLAGRIDLKKYYNGVETLLNTIPLATGAAMRRPGFEYIATTKYTETTAELIPFEYNTEQAYALEFGNKYMRVFADGGQVVTPDSYTKYLLHFDGTEGSTTIADSSTTGYTEITAVGNAKITTSQKKFGTGSAAFAQVGSSDYISIPASSDFTMLTDVFTIDCWLNFSVISQSAGIFTNYSDVTSNDVNFSYNASTPGLQFIIREGGSTTVSVSAPYTFTKNTWYHVAIIRGSSSFNIAINGVFSTDVTADPTDSWFDMPGNPLKIGLNTGSAWFYGKIDEFRVSKGTARWTAAFTPPTAPYPVGGGGTAYELTTPFLEGHLKDLRYCQSADTMYIAHEGYTPTKLTRTDHDAWTLTDITWDDEQWPPFQGINTTSTTLTASSTSGSIAVTASTALFSADSIGTFYRLHGGYFAVTAYTSTTQVTGMVADALSYSNTATASWYEGAWSIRRGWPRTVNFFEERLVFGGSPNQPDTIWMSATGDFENFSTQAGAAIANNDAVIFTIASDAVNAIMWTRPTQKLLIGTTGGEYWLSGQTTSEAVTPSSILVRRETDYGSQGVDAVGVGSDVFFVQQHGRKIRGFGYDYESDRYIGNDLTLLAEHLTRTYGIIDIVYQAEPYGVLWALRDDGVLLGLTYLQEQEVIAWHKHTTDGEFESITVIPGTSEDELWTIVLRTIGSSTSYTNYRYVERMKPQFDGTLANAFFVDSGLTYSGTAANTISGFTHLTNERVQVLADGVYRGYTTISSNSVALTPSATIVSVGLPYTSTIKTMRLAKGDGSYQGVIKKISKVTTRFYETVGCEIGQDADSLDSYAFTDATLFSGDKKMTFPGRDNAEGQIILQQTKPYPWTILCIIPKFDVTER